MSTPAETPVCPRHPDRVSYVRCQRCRRPVCPECQRPAAVGVHCVDCVAEATGVRDQARPRTALGARLQNRRPVVTITVIVLCAAAFAYQMAAPGVSVIREFGFVPALAQEEPWRFITSAFLHSQGLILHILFNMYLLWLVGPYLEVMLGRARFIALYVVSALSGSVAVLALADPTSTAWVTVTIGASGAVFGLFGALLMVLRRLERNVTQILVFFAINAVLGFVVPNVSWQGHLGGLVAGLVLGTAFAYAPKERRLAVSWGAVVAYAVFLGVLVAISYGSL